MYFRQGEEKRINIDICKFWTIYVEGGDLSLLVKCMK
jgi:hypothetical protein